MLDSFELHTLESALAATPFANHIHHLASTPSTQTLAHAAARSGTRWGVWIADEQTAGRGRGAHTWHSEAAFGLYLTALVSPQMPTHSALQLSFLTAIAVQSAIAQLFPFRIPDEIDIRWPNDLLLHGRKVGGILIETSIDAATHSLRYAAVGIGLNVNHLTFPPDIDPIATSIRRELPSPSASLPREPLAANILLALLMELDHLASNPAPQPSHLARSTWLEGKRVRVEAPNRDQPGVGSCTGTTAGLTADGFLLVRTDDGQLHTVLSGGLRELESERRAE